MKNVPTGNTEIINANNKAPEPDDCPEPFPEPDDSPGPSRRRRTWHQRRAASRGNPPAAAAPNGLLRKCSAPLRRLMSKTAAMMRRCSLTWKELDSDDE